MTRATRKKLQQIAALGLRERLGGNEPADVAVALDALLSRPQDDGQTPGACV